MLKIWEMKESVMGIGLSGKSSRGKMMSILAEFCVRRAA